MCRRTIGVFVFLSVAVVAQHGSTTAVNPYTGPEHARAGAKLYRAQCAGCHGPEGAGTGAGPNLAAGVFKRGGTDEALFQTISKGVPGTTMPAFSLSGLQTWQLVTYVRSLAISRSAELAKGDPKAGEELFLKSCISCHSVRNTGGLSGPDLSDVGLKRSGADLRQALSNPDSDVPFEYWSVNIKTMKGQTVRGTRLNEDTHSLQIRDGEGKLISVLKSEIDHYELVRESPMPSFTGKFSEAQIDDLIAYLTRLREER